jgi:hypothetical protein
MLKVVHDDGHSNATGAGSSVLDEIVRDGAVLVHELIHAAHTTDVFARFRLAV